MGMKHSFSALGENILTRKFGGTQFGVADPYLTGYHFIWLDILPAKLPLYTRNFNSGLTSNSDIQKVLAASCLSVTPPGGTLSKVEFAGLGGVKWSVPGAIEYGNEVSIKFLEFNKTPVLDIMSGWVKMIRDYRTGTTDLIDLPDGSGYSKETYAGLLYYWTTAPDAYTIEFFACYDGVFPTKDPADLYGSDIETIGRLDVEIPFHVDYAWREPWVLAKCESFRTEFTDSKNKVEAYYS